MLPHVLFITIYFYNIYNDNTGCRNNQREGRVIIFNPCTLLSLLHNYLSAFYHKCLYKIRIQCAYLNNVSFSLDYFYDCHNWYPNYAENNHTPA